MRDYKKIFSIDGITYELSIINYCADISIIGGILATGERIKFYEDSFEPNTTKYGINSKTKNPRKVLRVFRELILEYIYECRPPYLTFSAIEENRIRIYYKLLENFIPKDYSLSYNNKSSNFYLFNSIAQK
jgi:hypothetical protein